jgi:hypothetical protein
MKQEKIKLNLPWNEIFFLFQKKKIGVDITTTWAQTRISGSE